MSDELRKAALALVLWVEQGAWEGEDGSPTALNALRAALEREPSPSTKEGAPLSDDGCVAPWRSDMHPDCPPTCSIRKRALDAAPRPAEEKCPECLGWGYLGTDDHPCGTCRPKDLAAWLEAGRKEGGDK